MEEEDEEEEEEEEEEKVFLKKEEKEKVVCSTRSSNITENNLHEPLSRPAAYAVNPLHMLLRLSQLKTTFTSSVVCTCHFMLSSVLSVWELR